jgi:hypothetical protein
MTKQENERLAVVETKMDMVLDEMRAGFERNEERQDRIDVRLSAFEGFKGKMIGGAIVGGIVITAVATIVPVLVR